MLPFAWFFVKLMALLFTFVMFRTALPRFRYDQLMNLGWKLLIPVALGWFLLLVAIQVGHDRGWNLAVVIAVTVVALGLFAALLRQTVRAADARRLVEEVR